MRHNLTSKVNNSFKENLISEIQGSLTFHLCDCNLMTLKVRKTVMKVVKSGSLGIPDPADP